MFWRKVPTLATLELIKTVLEALQSRTLFESESESTLNRLPSHSISSEMQILSEPLMNELCGGYDVRIMTIIHYKTRTDIS
jgi:hypothetical protein